MTWIVTSAQNHGENFMTEIYGTEIKVGNLGALFWLFEPVKRPDDGADFCLDCNFFPYCRHEVLVFTLEVLVFTHGVGREQECFQRNLKMNGIMLNDEGSIHSLRVGYHRPSYMVGGIRPAYMSNSTAETGC